MSYEPFQRNDKRLVLIVLVLIAVAAVYVSANYRAAFPQASLNLKYSKDDITELAEQYLADQGFEITDYKNLTLFDPDNNARLFLERELGLEEANRLMEGDVAVWRWRARWFKPPEKEEFVVYLSPEGRLVGFRHLIAESQAGPRLDKDEARAIARRFLESQTNKPHELIEEELQERPNRYDYVFTWEQSGFKLKDGTYRRSIVVQGGQIGAYSEFVHVPERWQREYAALRSSNNLYGGIAQAFYLLLILASVAVLIQSLRRREIQWRPLLILCGVVAVATIVNEWNLLPFFIDSMPTNSPYHNTIILGLLQGLGAGVGYFFYVILGAAPGEPVYRKCLPGHMSLGSAFTKSGVCTREFFRATVAGYGFTAVHMVFLVAFYLLGGKLGVWAPQDVGYSDLLSTAVPWIYPLTIGLLASTSEEFWFRLLAIPLLRRYVRVTWIAVVIPAFVWAFLHSNYPQQPGFIRGIEIGVIGVAAGFLMLRFGIVATLIWHYTIDALLVSSILFQSNNWSYYAAGVVVSLAALAPLGFSLVRYRRHGGFVSEERLLNSSVTVHASEPEERVADQPAPPLKPRWPVRWLYLAAVPALLALLICHPIKFGDFTDIKLNATGAVSIAGEALAQKGISVSDWRNSVSFMSNLNVEDFEYIRRIEGPEESNRIVSERALHGVWMVRHFRPELREEWVVFVNQDGVAYRIDHVLEETAPGANLEPEAARLAAESHLTEKQGVNLADYRLVSDKAEKRENRTDYQFVWEDRTFEAGEAKARLTLSLTGDEPGTFRKFLKLPEEWVREFERPRLQRYVVTALAGAVGLPLLIIFIRRVGARDGRRPRLRWRFHLLAGGAAALLYLLDVANSLRSAFGSYNTAEPWQNFLGRWVIGNLAAALLTGLGVFLAFIAADVFLQNTCGYRRAARTSLARTCAICLLLAGTVMFFGWASGLLPGDRFSLPLWDIAGGGVFPAGFFGVAGAQRCPW